MADRMNCRLMEVVTLGEWVKLVVVGVFIVGQNGAQFKFQAEGIFF
jgi:hypothetical protein